MSTTDPLFNVASVKTRTEALGPGRRMAIWFQGCNLNCKGCCNPELQPLEPRHLVRLSEILRIASVAKEENGIEGVTLIGGEPTLQASLPALAEGLQSLGLGVIMFTGRLFSELDESLTRHLDTVIDGRFEIDNRDKVRNLVGSNNQRIINITNRYADDDWFTKLRPDYAEIDLDGETVVSSGSSY